MQLVMLLKKPILILQLVDIVLNRYILRELQVTALYCLDRVDCAGEELLKLKLPLNFTADIVLGVLGVVFEEVLNLKLLLLIIPDPLQQIIVLQGDLATDLLGDHGFDHVEGGIVELVGERQFGVVEVDRQGYFFALLDVEDEDLLNKFNLLKHYLNIAAAPVAGESAQILQDAHPLVEFREPLPIDLVADV